jgi:hypothetical protein
VPSAILATGSDVILERETRFELAASSLADLRSGQLSYSRLINDGILTERRCGALQSATGLPHLKLVRRERLELSLRRLRGDCFTRLAYGARRNRPASSAGRGLAELARFELAASR